LAETGFGRNVATGTNVASGSVEVVLGEAEWAATQTVHFAASVALEWLCATNSTADIKVNSRHIQAIDLEIDRMIWNSLLESTPKREADAIRMPEPLTPVVHEESTASVMQGSEWF
jgi:tetrahydromethanopterin S-methyltransferase subunit H